MLSEWNRTESPSYSEAFCKTPDLEALNALIYEKSQELQILLGLHKEFKGLPLSEETVELLDSATAGVLRHAELLFEASIEAEEPQVLPETAPPPLTPHTSPAQAFSTEKVEEPQTVKKPTGFLETIRRWGEFW